MDWYIKIKEWYRAGIWTADMVQDAAKIGKITEEQMEEILGEQSSYANSTVASVLVGYGN